MAVLSERIGVGISIVLCAILLSCSTLFFEPDFQTDEDIPEIVVESSVDTITVGDLYTVIFNVLDDEDDPEFLKENATIWVEDENGESVDMDTFTKESGTYTVFVFVTDSDGNTSEIAEITVVVSDEDKTPPEITLLGPDNYTVNKDDYYHEPGAVAVDNVDGNLTDKITFVGEPETSEEGVYTLTYTVRDKAGNRAYKYRRVTVKKNNGDDTEKPQITLKGNNPMMVHLGDSFKDPGASANDNKDGNITHKIKKFDIVDTAVEGTYGVLYTVEDEAGNVAFAKRIVLVEIFIDSIPPVITLHGDNPLYLELHEEYNEPGAEAQDNIDGNVTDKIDINDNGVDIHHNGIYNVFYTVSDVAGNEAKKKRIVSVGVIDTIPPHIVLLGETNMLVDYKGPYKEPGAFATDDIEDTIPYKDLDVDKDIDLNVLGTNYKVTYIATDKGGNADTAVRKIEVADTIKPKITIIGPTTINLAIGYDYKEYGATALDNYDGDLTDKLDTLGNVNTSSEGTYEITYQVTDSNGNTGKGIRTVNVLKDFEAPKIHLIGQDPFMVKINTSFTDPGAFAVDNVDDTISFSEFTVSDNVDVSKVGNYTVNYSVSDEAGNEAKTTRSVKVALTIQVVETFSLNRRTLDKKSNTGSSGGKVGARARGSTGTDSFETLFYNALSSLEDKTILNVTFRAKVSHVDEYSRNKTAALFEQNKGDYSSTARYSTYSNSAWTASLGTIRTYSSGWKEIEGTSLKNLVQSWVDGRKDNEGLIMGGNFGEYNAYWNIDDAQLVVEWEE